MSDVSPHPQEGEGQDLMSYYPPLLCLTAVPGLSRRLSLIHQGSSNTPVPFSSCCSESFPLAHSCRCRNALSIPWAVLLGPRFACGVAVCSPAPSRCLCEQCRVRQVTPAMAMMGLCVQFPVLLSTQQLDLGGACTCGLLGGIQRQVSGL